jgi:hypothetical protein
MKETQKAGGSTKALLGMAESKRLLARSLRAEENHPAEAKILEEYARLLETEADLLDRKARG